MKLMICGHARHGKDHAAEYLTKNFGLRHESSSHIAMRTFLREKLATRFGLVYESEEACYLDRANHRDKWFRLIQGYNVADPARLARLIYSQADIYVGIRAIDEFTAAKYEQLFDLSIWIDASGRLPPEGKDSNQIKPDDCDLVITNNRSVEDFEKKLWRVFMPMIRWHQAG